MDVLNEKEIKRDLVDPTLNRIHAETIPQLQKVIDESVAKAVVGASQALAGVLQLGLTQAGVELGAIATRLEAVMDRAEALANRGINIRLGND